MDNNVVLYQVNDDLAEKIFRRVEEFNRGRRDDMGYYAISVATPFRSYYALWRVFTNVSSIPVFVQTLAVTMDDAVQRAIGYLLNCNVKLLIKDNTFFEPYYGMTADIVEFGKYRGKRLSEIYRIDPNYVLWLANKFEPRTYRNKKLSILAKGFARVHYETMVMKGHIPGASRHIGVKGEKLTDLNLTVLGVRYQLDSYKRGYYVDQSVLATDADGNRFSFVVKAAGESFAPDTLNCHTRKFSPQEHLHIRQAKVLSHFESRGVKYTRIGYVKF